MAEENTIIFSHKNVEAFPIGSVFLSVLNTNPLDLLGYGTWELIGSGRTILGASDTDEGEEIGGSMSKSLSAANIPSHTHSIAQHNHVLNSHGHTASSNDYTHSHTVTVNGEGNHLHNTRIYYNPQGAWSGDLKGQWVLGDANDNHGTAMNSGYTSADGYHVHSASSGNNTHKHTITVANSGNLTTNNGGPTSTGASGSGSALDITPAYLKIFIWKRTK